MIVILVAYDQNYLIGNNNKLPWKIPEELSHFKNVTLNKTILFGDKTYLNLDSKLDDREIFVLTKDKNLRLSEKNVHIIHNYDQILNKYHKNPKHNIYICGGRDIYKIFLKYADELIISEIYKEYKGDKYFPKWDKDRYILSKEKKYSEFLLKHYVAR